MKGLMGVTAVQVRHWTRDEYQKMGEAGIFPPGERVELIEGKIIKMIPQRSFHAAGVRLAQDTLREAYGPGFDVRPQLPLSLGLDSEPESDTAVVRGEARDYVKAHPTTAVLVVEVADTMLEFDPGPKARLYAKAAIPEYWIVNLVDRLLEVHRDPVPLPGEPGSYGYRSIQRFAPHDSVKPLSAGARAIRVADLLPCPPRTGVVEPLPVGRGPWSYLFPGGPEPRASHRR